VSVTVPPPPTDGSQPSITRARLTEEKKKLIRLVVAFVIATKHHLRAEGGVHHEDLKGAFASSIRLGKSRRGGLGRSS
jgi:putative membrane protein